MTYLRRYDELQLGVANLEGLSQWPIRNEDFVGDSISTDQADAKIDIDGSSSSPVDEDLVGVVVSNSDEAFELYNGYAYRVGFSVRKGQQRYKASTKSIQMKRFFCAKAGYKEKPNSGVKVYSKIDIRTGCGALVQFDVLGGGMDVDSYKTCERAQS
ncbi:PREDICTED: protein FAR1-RELATED SEQUENCE 7-like [Ipomoea nil]|uniref:protein FAR1-RELATED SEQUENCE 7-like n=1 Tax=Ipomoea nil TaxID=35883 RepID=UPI000901A25B|nr:PREDICTED: protein FAR1-RELATED SEQUENCE 7-like [Ipomoea nil]